MTTFMFEVRTITKACKAKRTDVRVREHTLKLRRVSH